MAYADFTYYSNVYNGNVISTETEFRTPSERATDYINSVTFGRAKEVTDEETLDLIKKCCCAVAEQECLFSKHSDVVSEKTGSHTITFATFSEEQKSRERHHAALMYLGSTGLMYRGVE